MFPMLRKLRSLAFVATLFLVPAIAAASISNYAENKLLDTLSNTSFAVTTSYASLHTANPGETCTDEATGGSYARQSVSWNAASSGAKTNSATISFTGMPAATVTHLCLWDASSAGNCLWCGALTSSVALPGGSTYQITAGNLSVSLD